MFGFLLFPFLYFEVACFSASSGLSLYFYETFSIFYSNKPYFEKSDHFLFLNTEGQLVGGRLDDSKIKHHEQTEELFEILTLSLEFLYNFHHLILLNVPFAVDDYHGCSLPEEVVLFFGVLEFL